MNTPEFTKNIVALACWKAAKKELHQVMLAVGQVFVNRAAAGWYAGDLYENAWRWLDENSKPFSEEFPDIRDPQFLQLLLKLDPVILGQVPDKTAGALWFAPKTSEKISGTVTTTMGNLIFFR